MGSLVLLRRWASSILRREYLSRRTKKSFSLLAGADVLFPRTEEELRDPVL